MIDLSTCQGACACQWYTPESRLSATSVSVVTEAHLAHSRDKPNICPALPVRASAYQNSTGWSQDSPTRQREADRTVPLRYENSCSGVYCHIVALRVYSWRWSTNSGEG